MVQELEIFLQGNQFRRIFEQLVMEIRKKYNLKRVEIEILFYLANNPDHDTARDIQNDLKLNKGHISQSMDTLCKLEYLQARPDEQDRRYIHYTITSIARPLVEDIDTVWKLMREKLLEGFSAEEINLLINMTGRLVGNMGKIVKKDS